MSTLAKPEAREACCARLEKLSPSSGRHWGRMTPHQMLCHLRDSFEAAAGERKTSPAPSLLPRGFVKWVAIHTALPWAHNFKTRPEVEQGRGGTPPADWNEDKQGLRRWIESFPQRKTFAPHPMFGPMTWDEWQIWAYRHTDHHFRQFGI